MVTVRYGRHCVSNVLAVVKCVISNLSFHLNDNTLSYAPLLCAFLLVVCVHSFSARQQADDIKAIERAKLDLQRVQSQLQVVEEKTSAVRKEHHQLTLTFQSDEMRMTSLENDLKVCT